MNAKISVFVFCVEVIIYSLLYNLNDCTFKQKKIKIINEKDIKEFESIHENGKFHYEIEKQNFHQHKKPILIKNININKIVVSNKVSFGKKGFKYFVCYKDAKKLDIYVHFSQK